MLLYSCISLVLFVTLIISITDCRNNGELKIRRNICFGKSIYTFSFICLLLLFWFLTAFRGDSIGNDTVSYLHYYEEIAKNGINTNWNVELGYQYFCLLLSKLNPDPYFILTVSATICYGICGIYIYKNSDNILYSVCFLFCVAFSFFTSGIRQSIAMVIVLIAYQMIRKNRYIVAIILILLATLFHTTAVVAFLWLAHKFVPKKPVYVIILALTTTILAASGVMNSLLAAILVKYQGYFYSENVGTGWLGIACDSLRAVVFYLFTYFACKEEQEKKSLVVSNTVLLLFTICLGFSVNLFKRVSLYFLLPIVVDLPNVFNSGKIRNREIWMLIIGIVMIAYFMVILIFRPEWNNLYPYEFNWS